MSDAEIMAMSGLADSALQVAGNITASTFNYKHTKELAEWQNKMNIQNWQMQNEYNLPSAQMERIKAAGLNPNLMYGQGNPGNAGSIAGASVTPQNQVKNPFEGVALASQYQNLKNMSIQGQNMALQGQEEYLKIWDRAMAFNAWQQFAYDHRPKDSNIELPILLIPNKKGTFSEVQGGDDYSHYIRGSAQYKKLDLMWQAGDINDKNLHLLDQQHDIRSRKAGTNAAYDRILNGEGSIDDYLRVIFDALLDRLSGAGGSWTNSGQYPGTTFNF